MNATLARCLEDLERRIVPEEEDRLYQQWVDFAEGRFQGSLFMPQRRKPRPPKVEWPSVRVNAALEDFDAMALQQYAACSEVLRSGAGTLMAVRANYGTGILPSLFGVEPFLMPEEMDTLPTNRPLPDVEAIGRVIEAGPRDVESGMGPRVLEMYRRFQAIAEEYPNIGRYVHLYHPDLQGPMDVCELLWGSGLFLYLIEDPPLVKALLDVVTETYIRFMRAWAQVAPFRKGGNVHWGFYHKGNIVLRDDSAMNLSPDMFCEFVRPYDQRLLREFGGGMVHFCGRGDHYIAHLCEMTGVFAVNMSQPEWNNMDVIFRHTVDKGIVLVGLPRRAGEQAVAAGRNLRGRVQCGQ